MSISKLAKIPLVILMSICCQVYLTPPSTLPDAEEQEKYNKEHKLPDAVPISNVVAPKVYKLTGHILNALEIVAIIHAVYPDVAQVLAVPWLDAASLADTGDKIYTSMPFTVGIILLICGTLIRAACFRHLGQHFTFQLSIRKGHRLVTSGPYSVVRHPGYTSLYLCFAGTILCQLGSGSFWAESGLWDHPWWRWFGVVYAGYRVYVSFVIFKRIKREDTVLRKEFGDEWVVWAKKTPYKLLPLVY